MFGINGFLPISTCKLVALETLGGFDGGQAGCLAGYVRLSCSITILCSFPDPRATGCCAVGYDNQSLDRYLTRPSKIT